MSNPAISQTVSFDVGRLHRRHLLLMQHTLDILTHVVAPISQEIATTLRDGRDGPKGWSVVEVLCHLRDYDNIFRMRAEMMRAQEYPNLPYYDHEVLAVERAYNSQQLVKVMEELTQSRRATIAFFEQLQEADWERAGVHPERGHFTMTDALVQVGTHDATHIEQITRILFQNE
jgi:hypothetical protein